MELSPIIKLPHHEQSDLCHTRSLYRQGKKLTAIKVYTINDESQHLIISGVPKLDLRNELLKIIVPYGEIKQLHPVADYPTEEFTEAFHVQFAAIQSARIAKRFTDGKNFFGGLLHVFYSPELESIAETRVKLIKRQKDVLRRIQKNQKDFANSDTNIFVPIKQYHRRKKNPALPLDEDRLHKTNPGETLQSIYNKIPQELDRRLIPFPSLPQHLINNHNYENLNETNPYKAPYEPMETILCASSNDQFESIKNSYKVKRNYKGKLINDTVKSKIVRPSIIDTRQITIAAKSQSFNSFAKVKKVDKGITIKLKTGIDDAKKRIVIKNTSVKELVRPSEKLQETIHLVRSNIRSVMMKNEKEMNGEKVNLFKIK
ncbi:RNA-binding protein 48 [Prorops nasuta]|uniref:RNA-binding protein 48 n=1 Tax=Prorops nasuta TaxID=863751 RepID=UPI0034CDCE0E